MTKSRRDVLKIHPAAARDDGARGSAIHARDVEVFTTKRQSSHGAIILATAETVNGLSEFSYVREKLHREAGGLAFIDAYTRVHGSPQPAFRAPDGPHAGAPRPHPP